MNVSGTAPMGPSSTQQPFSPFVQSLFQPTLTPESRIDSLAKLLLAEEILDDLASQQPVSIQYRLLSTQAEGYIRSNPELLDAPWLRNGGAVYDMIARMREQRLQTAAQGYEDATGGLQ